MTETKTVNRKIFYELYHSSDDFFIQAMDLARKAKIDDIRQAFMEGNYELVHKFRMPAEDVEGHLEAVFDYSQNLDRHWRRKKPCRSTSVGDLIRVKGEFWIVASVSFHYGWR